MHRAVWTVCFFAHVTAAASFADLTAEELAKAQKLYTAKCARCHRLYDPRRYDDENWEKWMGKMRKKSHLGEDQYTLLRSYTEQLRHPLLENPKGK